MLTNPELEHEFEQYLLSECSHVEREFYRTHPLLRKYALTWFVRGYDSGEGRYAKLVQQVIDEFQPQNT